MCLLAAASAKSYSTYDIYSLDRMTFVCFKALWLRHSPGTHKLQTLASVVTRQRVLKPISHSFRGHCISHVVKNPLHCHITRTGSQEHPFWVRLQNSRVHLFSGCKRTNEFVRLQLEKQRQKTLWLKGHFSLFAVLCLKPGTKQHLKHFVFCFEMRDQNSVTALIALMCAYSVLICALQGQK